MLFSIETKVLLQGLQDVSRAISSKSPVPILQGILIKARKNELVLVGSNSDIYINATIQDESLNVSEEGITVFPRLLTDIISKITDDLVSISVFDEVSEIKTKNSHFKLNCFSTLDTSYPEQNFEFNSSALVIKGDQLRSIINTTSYCAASADNRPILQGVSFKISDNHLICVATDSYRLARKEIILEEEYVDKEIVIPYSTLNELKSILPTFNFNVEIYFDTNKVTFKYENMIISSRLLQGNYPDTSRLIPKEFPLQVTLVRDDLIHVAELANLFIGPNQDNIVIFTLKPSGLVEIKSYDNSLGNSKQDIKPINDLAGKEFVIAFNAKHLREALKAFMSNEVTLNFTNSSRQIIITSEKESDQLHLILPVRAD